MDPINCFLGFSVLDRREKKAETIFSLDRTSFLRKTSFLLTSLVLEEWSYDLHKTDQNFQWTNPKGFLSFVILDKAKKGQKYFSTRKLFFFQKFVFSVTSYLLQKWLWTCQLITILPFELTLGVCHTRYCEKRWTKTVFRCEKRPFF